MTILSFIGIPRTGSTQVMRSLSSFRALDAYGEIFHRHKCFGLRAEFLEDLARRTGSAFPADPSSPATIDYVRSHPHQVLDALGDVAGAGCAAFKVFPNHLEQPLMKAEILQRRDVELVFLRRRVIDTYVSGLKSKQANSWQYLDTTELRVRADIAQFESWARAQQRWYADCVEVAAAAGKPIRLMTFETEIEPGMEATVAYLRDVLQDIGVPTDANPETVEPMPRQDRSSDLADKVENWREFDHDLTDRGLSDLAMGYFVEPADISAVDGSDTGPSGVSRLVLAATQRLKRPFATLRR